MMKLPKPSSEVVFSTSLTLEAAQIRNQKIDMSKAIILPQGKCDIPKDANNTANSSEEKAWLRVVLRPSSFIDDRPVVIGAGSVIFRKGVDLFIEMATRVLKMPGGENTFFFWIGASNHPDQPWDYPVYLEDQIRRAGVENRVTILRGTSEIELAYSLADIFVLSSRLDPLPNVAIDAMSVGLPVICFENASGIAEFLVDASLRDACVADYIDTHALAEKVYALVTDPTLRGKVSTRIQEYAETAFNFDSYARKIESLGLNARVG